MANFRPEAAYLDFGMGVGASHVVQGNYTLRRHIGLIPVKIRFYGLVVVIPIDEKEINFAVAQNLPQALVSTLGVGISRNGEHLSPALAPKSPENGKRAPAHAPDFAGLVD
jgi:hypothetical protein